MKTPAELAASLRERLIHSRPHYDIKGQPLRTIVVTQEWLEDMADAANALDADPVSQGEPVAFASVDVDGSPTMLFFSRDEARAYCDAGVEPISLGAMRKATEDLRAEFARIDAEEDAKPDRKYKARGYVNNPVAYVTDDYGHEGVSHSISASLPVGTPLYAGKPVSVNKF